MMESIHDTDMRTEDDEVIQDERWHIEDDGGAIWAIDKMRQNAAERDKRIEWWKRQIELEQQRCNARNAYLEQQLYEYAGTLPMRETKTQFKYDFYNGTLVLHKRESDYAVDKPALLEHFKQSGLADYIKVEESPMWGEYKKRLEITDAGVLDTKTGELLSCVTVEQRPERFEVKI